MMRRLAFIALMGVAAVAAAQVRTIPKEAQRGEIRHLQAMYVELNGKPLQLSPGAQIRDTHNRLVLPTSLAEKYDVRYLLDGTGLVRLTTTHTGFTLKTFKHQCEKEFLESALRRHNWDYVAAARSLDIQRTYLHRKIAKLGILKP